MSGNALITRALLLPSLVTGLSVPEWDLLVRQGRRANLLARLAHRIIEQQLMDRVPPRPRSHLLSALRMADRQSSAMRWEVECILRALAGVDERVILLKGAAYLLSDLPTAKGRTFADVDILVPKQRIAEVESQLMLHGWQGTHHDDYDQRYYRQWMHEIPPLRHVKRGTSIDVHHTVLPESARLKINTALLFQSAIAVPGHGRLYVLAPVDMVLHSATHLFHEGTLDNGLRDLFDLDCLLRHFGAIPDFWEQLVPRAAELGMRRPLYYALRYCSKILNTPRPVEVINELEPGKPAPIVSSMMDFCYQRALSPHHDSCSTNGSRLATAFLYIRSHWLRMPFPLLVQHLLRKAMRNSTARAWETLFTPAPEKPEP